MQLMRAIFKCNKTDLTEILTFQEQLMEHKLDLAIHEESEEEETTVSGAISSVMHLIGAVAANGCAFLNEAWVYEC